MNGGNRSSPPIGLASPTALLTAAQACQILGIGRRKLWELTNRGEIVCVRIGRAVRYDPRDLQAFIDRHKGRRS
jgi:excisionase family DNA binding protein